MDFQLLVKEARSCRRFNEEQKIGLQALEWLVDCARIAPCARNAQVLRYALAHSQSACATIFPCTRWAGILDWNGPACGERPTGYIAILVPQDAGKLVYMDTGIAAQTIQLAAQSKGIGCCMHASFKAQELTSFFEVPENMSIALILGLGVEKERRVLAAMPEDGSYNYWRDSSNIHHVPKRSLDEVILCCK